MQVEINKQKYELVFGFKFLKEVNAKLGLEIEVHGQAINTRAGGLDYVISGLDSADPNVIMEVIKAGTSVLKVRPSEDEIEYHIGNLLTNDVEAYVDLAEQLKKEIEEDTYLEGLRKAEALIQERQNKSASQG